MEGPTENGDTLVGNMDGIRGNAGEEMDITKHCKLIYQTHVTELRGNRARFLEE